MLQVFLLCSNSCLICLVGCCRLEWVIPPLNHWTPRVEDWTSMARDPGDKDTRVCSHAHGLSNVQSNSVVWKSVFEHSIMIPLSMTSLRAFSHLKIHTKVCIFVTLLHLIFATFTFTFTFYFFNFDLFCFPVAIMQVHWRTIHDIRPVIVTYVSCVSLYL